MTILFSIFFIMVTPAGALPFAMAAPIIAALLVRKAKAPWAARGRAWLGITIGLTLAMFVPVLCFYISVLGGDANLVFFLAAPFGLYAIWLGARVVSTHRRHLRGQPVATRGTRLHALGFGLAVALALLPWCFGAMTYLGAGEFDGEFELQGNALIYLAHVVPTWLLVYAEVRLLRQIERSGSQETA